jgi:pilus assembly protein CpaF
MSVAGHPQDALSADRFEAIKIEVHRRLVEAADLAKLAAAPRADAETELRAALESAAADRRIPLNRRERTRLVAELVDEILGLGPLEPLVRDPDVQDILVNGHEDVYVERRGVLEKTAVRFRDAAHLRQIADRIVAAVGRRVDEASPMVDARLPDGSRVNVIVPPLALNGVVLSLRRFGAEPLDEAALVANQTLAPEMRAFLAAAVAAKLNILVSGGTGSGKTTLLNALSTFIPPAERIITIEDSAELRLRQPHVVTLEARPPNLEGRGEVRTSQLVKNSLRMRPDRILVGEARGAEVLDMLQAMNTGHPGSLSTIHANSPRDALSRIEIMASMGTGAFSEAAIRRLVGSAIDLVVQLARLPDGSRRVVSISELAGLENGELRFTELFVFEQRGVDARGRATGVFRATGAPCAFRDHLRTHGHELPERVFAFERPVA